MKDRFDVVAAHREAGLEVPRQGKDYLAASDPETGDRWRLNGRLYAFDFCPDHLTERRRPEHGRREIEELTASELGWPAGNSRRVARNALLTIERKTEEATARIRALLLRVWPKPLIVGLSLSLGICAESWATTWWLWTRIQARTETAAELAFDIEETRQTLARMEVDVWRIALPKIEEELAVMLSAGTLDKPRWIAGPSASGLPQSSQESEEAV